jgi:hypothetical protein
MTGRQSSRALVFACALNWASIAWALSARADDSSPGVPLPGLRSDPPGHIRVMETAIDLNGEHIVTIFTLRQTGATDRSIGVDGPLFTWRGDADPYPDRQFAELRATLDGADAPPGNGFVSLFETRDISALIREAGLDPFVIAESPPIVVRPAGSSAAAFDRLLTAQAVRASDGQFLARWSSRRIFRFALGHRAETVLSLDYRPRPGFVLLAFRDVARAIQLTSYCVTPAALAAHLGTSAVDRRFVMKTYNIAAGVNGQPPERATLRVASPDAVFCTTGGQPAFGGVGLPARQVRTGDGIARVLEFTPVD